MSRLQALLQLLAADPGDFEVHYMLGMEYRSSGDWAKAITHFDDCLRLNPAYSPAFFQKGNTHIAAGRIDDARAALQEGIRTAISHGDNHDADEMRAVLNDLAGH